jgi:hypothetical protein
MPQPRANKMTSTSAEKVALEQVLMQPYVPAAVSQRSFVDTLRYSRSFQDVAVVDGEIKGEISPAGTRLPGARAATCPLFVPSPSCVSACIGGRRIGASHASLA